MSSFARLLPAVAALALLSAPALAADLLPPLPDIEPPRPIAVGGGWYLRGDVGVGMGLRGKNVATPPTVAVAGGLAPLDTAIARNRINKGWSLSGGVGYRFNQNLRADVTAVALSGVRMHGYGVDQAFASGASQGLGHYSAGVRTNVALANVYWDVLTWNGLTPYVGAGVGAAYNRVHSASRYEQSAPYMPATYPLAIRHRGHASAAFALYAGVAYEIMPGLNAELGYRYLQTGGLRSGRAVCVDNFVCATAAPLRTPNLHSHDITLGVRWDLNPILSL